MSDKEVWEATLFSNLEFEHTFGNSFGDFFVEYHHYCKEDEEYEEYEEYKPEPSDGTPEGIVRQVFPPKSNYYRWWSLIEYTQKGRYCFMVRVFCHGEDQINRTIKRMKNDVYRLQFMGLRAKPDERGRIVLCNVQFTKMSS